MEIKQRKIAFDLDGVIIDHSRTKIEFAAKLNHKISPEQTPGEILGTLIPLSDYRKIQYAIYHDPVFSQKSVLMAGVKEALAAIKDRGLEYFLISARIDLDNAIKLMRKLGIWPKFFSEKNATFVSLPAYKNSKAVKLGITDFVDDELKVIATLSAIQNKYLFDPYDVFQEADFFKKINSWKKFQKILKL